jgi:hypothetical protein
MSHSPQSRIAVTLMIIGVTAPCRSQTTADVPHATVHISAFGPFGQAIDKPTLHLYTPDRKQDLARGSNGRKIDKVPYGQYTLIAWSSDGGIGQRDVIVNAPELWIMIGIPVYTGDRLWSGGDLRIRGEVRPSPDNRTDWWIRVSGVFLNVAKETRIQRDGTFAVYGLDMGTYLIQVFERSKLRTFSQIELDPNSSTAPIILLVEP